MCFKRLKALYIVQHSKWLCEAFKWLNVWFLTIKLPVYSWFHTASSVSWESYLFWKLQTLIIIHFDEHRSTGIFSFHTTTCFLKGTFWLDLFWKWDFLNYHFEVHFSTGIFSFYIKYLFLEKNFLFTYSEIRSFKIKYSFWCALWKLVVVF